MFYHSSASLISPLLAFWRCNVDPSPAAQEMKSKKYHLSDIIVVTGRLMNNTALVILCCNHCLRNTACTLLYTNRVYFYMQVWIKLLKMGNRGDVCLVIPPWWYYCGMKWRRTKPDDAYLRSRILAFVRPWTGMYFECGGRLSCLSDAIAFLWSCVLTAMMIYTADCFLLFSCCFFYYLAFLCSGVLTFWHSGTLVPHISVVSYKTS